MDRHVGVAYEDDFVFAGNVLKHPVAFDALFRIHFRVFVHPLLQAVVEVIDLQIGEGIGLVEGLKQQTAKLLIRPHGSAGVDEHHEFQPVFSRRLHPDIQDPAPLAGVVDGSANVQLFFAGFQLS